MEEYLKKIDTYVASFFKKTADLVLPGLTDVAVICILPDLQKAVGPYKKLINPSSGKCEEAAMPVCRRSSTGIWTLRHYIALKEFQDRLGIFKN